MCLTVKRPPRSAPLRVPSPPVGKHPADWAELDLIRGVAGIIMVLNHAAAHWWGGDTASGFAGAMFELGSYAPVLFFATTGLGYGIQAEHKGPSGGHAFGFTRKVAILLLADSLMWLSPVLWLGNNFLGFIALTMLALEPLRASRHGWWLAGLGGIAVAAARFVVVPLVWATPDAARVPSMLDWVAGVGSPPGFAYPPLPWLAYGLLGFTAGALAQRHRSAVLARRGRIAVLAIVATVLGATVVAWRVQQGSVPVRWGAVNKTFFVASFVSLAAAGGLAFGLTRLDRAPRWLRLRGLSSLALVPIHYAVIFVLGLAGGSTATTLTGRLIAATAAVVASLAVAHAWPRVVRWLVARHAWTLLVGITAACFAGRLLIPSERPQIAIMIVAQLALCALLVVERRK